MKPATSLSAVFAENLYTARTTNRLSQSELAIQSGVTQQQISNIERKAVTPTLDTIEALARALGVDPVTLLRKEPPPKRGR